MNLSKYNGKHVRVLEKAGMTLVRTEKEGLKIENRVYDKLTYEYRIR